MMSEPSSSVDDAKRKRATVALEWAGFRLLKLNGVMAACIWADRDCPVVRAALRVLGYGGLPVKYLDSSDVPYQYKGRSEDAKLIPFSVLEPMLAAPERPWEIRDRLLSGLRWYPSYNEWKAATLNKLFEELGATGQRGNITGRTIAHGEAATLRAGNSSTAVAVRSSKPLPNRAPEREWTEAEKLIVSRAWSRWAKWRMQSPTAADQYRAAHQDETGALNWLLAFENFEIPKGKTSWIVEQCRDKEERRLLARVRDDAQAYPDKYGLGRCALCGEAAPWIAVFMTTQKLVRALGRAPDLKWVLVFGLCPVHKECGDAASEVEAQFMGESLFADFHGGVLVDAEAIETMRLPDDAGG